jgi:hypothetical protein
VPGNDIAFGITLVANGYAAVKFHPVVYAERASSPAVDMPWQRYGSGWCWVPICFFLPPG